MLLEMELYQIKTFLAVVEESSVTRAAKRLYTTPPSVSAHIKALEEELGVSLFDRSAKGMSLTGEGESIREKARRLLDAALEITSEAAELRGQIVGGIEIGLNSDPVLLQATRLASELRTRHPALELGFVDSESTQIIDAIRTENLDAGFFYPPIELRDFELTFLRRTKLAVTVPKGWQDLIENGDWKSIAKHPWIYTSCVCSFHMQIEKAFREHSLEFLSRVKANGDQTRRELVAEGMGIGVMEREQAERLQGEDKAIIWESSTPLFADLMFGFLKRRAKEPAIKAATEAIHVVWGTQ